MIVADGDRAPTCFCFDALRARSLRRALIAKLTAIVMAPAIERAGHSNGANVRLADADVFGGDRRELEHFFARGIARKLDGRPAPIEELRRSR